MIKLLKNLINQKKEKIKNISVNGKIYTIREFGKIGSNLRYYKKEIRNSIRFHHTPLHRDYDQSLDTPYRSVKSIISASEEKFGIEVSKIIRCRMNLTCPVPNFGPDNYNVPHVDWPDLENYFTLLYYLDDSDGDTFIFNEHYKDGFPKTVTIDRRISPKSNMALLMDGWKYHASSNPVKSNQRITINFKYFIYLFKCNNHYKLFI